MNIETMNRLRLVLDCVDGILPLSETWSLKLLQQSAWLQMLLPEEAQVAHDSKGREDCFHRLHRLDRLVNEKLHDIELFIPAQTRHVQTFCERHFDGVAPSEQPTLQEQHAEFELTALLQIPDIGYHAVAYKLGTRVATFSTRCHPYETIHQWHVLWALRHEPYACKLHDMMPAWALCVGYDDHTEQELQTLIQLYEPLRLIQMVRETLKLKTEYFHVLQMLALQYRRHDTFALFRYLTDLVQSAVVRDIDDLLQLAGSMPLLIAAVFHQEKYFLSDLTEQMLQRPAAWDCIALQWPHITTKFINAYGSLQMLVSTLVENKACAARVCELLFPQRAPLRNSVGEWHAGLLIWVYDQGCKDTLFGTPRQLLVDCSDNETRTCGWKLLLTNRARDVYMDARCRDMLQQLESKHEPDCHEVNGIIVSEKAYADVLASSMMLLQSGNPVEAHRAMVQKQQCQRYRYQSTNRKRGHTFAKWKKHRRKTLQSQEEKCEAAEEFRWRIELKALSPHWNAAYSELDHRVYWQRRSDDCLMKYWTLKHTFTMRIAEVWERLWPGTRHFPETWVLSRHVPSYGMDDRTTVIPCMN